MKILFVAHGKPRVIPGGIESYIECMAPAIARRGHEVHVLYVGWRQDEEDRFERGVAFHLRAWPGPDVLGRASGMRHATVRMRTALGVRRALNGLRESFDVVEAAEWMAPSLFLDRSLPQVLHLHTPVTVNASYWEDVNHIDIALADRLERRVARRAQVLTCPSRVLAAELRKRNWLPGPDPALIRYPIDLPHWADVPEADRSEPIVLFVGRIENRKAPEVLIDAAALLGRTDVHVIFLGASNGRRDGLPYMDWVRKRADQANVACTFTGPVDRDGLKAWYGRARVVAIPSRFDNFPMTGLEALAAGRALVCTATTGTAEILTPDAGAVVEADDPEGLAKVLRPYLEDASFAAQAGRHARSLAQRMADPDEIAVRREACFVEAIDRWERTPS